MGDLPQSPCQFLMPTEVVRVLEDKAFLPGDYVVRVGEAWGCGNALGIKRGSRKSFRNIVKWGVWKMNYKWGMSRDVPLPCLRFSARTSGVMKHALLENPLV